MNDQENQGTQADPDGSRGPALARTRISPMTSKIGKTTHEGVTPSTTHEVTAKTKPTAASPSKSRLHDSARAI